MSRKLREYVWENAVELNGSRFNVLLCLADHANSEGVCWPSMERIGKRARISERQAQRIVKELAQDGYLTIEYVSGRSSRYTINFTPTPDAIASPPTPDMVVSPTPDILTLQDAQNVAPAPDMVVSPTPDMVVSPKPSLTDNIEPKQRTTTTNIGVVVRSYESNIGVLSAHISEMLADAVDTYGAKVVEDAIKEAARQNVRKWAYVDGILKRWGANGKQKRSAPAAVAIDYAVVYPE